MAEVHINKELDDFITELQKAQQRMHVAAPTPESPQREFVDNLARFLQKLDEWRVAVSPYNNLPREIEGVPPAERPVERLLAVLRSGIAKLAPSDYLRLQEEIQETGPFFAQMVEAQLLGGASPATQDSDTELPEPASATALQSRLAGLDTPDSQPQPSAPAPQTTDESLFVLAHHPDSGTGQVHVQRDGLVYWGIPDTFGSTVVGLNHITGKDPRWRPPNWDKRSEEERGLLPPNGEPAVAFQSDPPVFDGLADGAEVKTDGWGESGSQQDPEVTELGRGADVVSVEIEPTREVNALVIEPGQSPETKKQTVVDDLSEATQILDPASVKAVQTRNSVAAKIPVDDRTLDVSSGQQESAPTSWRVQGFLDAGTPEAGVPASTPQPASGVGLRAHHSIAHDANGGRASHGAVMASHYAHYEVALQDFRLRHWLNPAKEGYERSAAIARGGKANPPYVPNGWSWIEGRPGLDRGQAGLEQQIVPESAYREFVGELQNARKQAWADAGRPMRQQPEPQWPHQFGPTGGSRSGPSPSLGHGTFRPM